MLIREWIVELVPGIICFKDSYRPIALASVIR